MSATTQTPAPPAPLPNGKVKQRRMLKAKPKPTAPAAAAPEPAPDTAPAIKAAAIKAKAIKKAKGLRTVGAKTPGFVMKLPKPAPGSVTQLANAFFTLKADFVKSLFATGIAPTEKQCAAWVSMFKSDVEGACEFLAKAA
jgi:hypothetical protein